MEMLTALVMFTALSAAAFAVNRVFGIRLCAACVGMSSTWLLLIALALSGRISIYGYIIPIALLMGGSVAGIAYQGEKAYPSLAGNVWKWKIPVMLFGFLTAYGALMFMSWYVWSALFITLATLGYLFFIKPESRGGSARSGGGHVAELEEKMKECC